MERKCVNSVKAEVVSSSENSAFLFVLLSVTDTTTPHLREGVAGSPKHPVPSVRSVLLQAQVCPDSSLPSPSALSEGMAESRGAPPSPCQPWR